MAGRMGRKRGRVRTRDSITRQDRRDNSKKRSPPNFLDSPEHMIA